MSLQADEEKEQVHIVASRTQQAGKGRRVRLAAPDDRQVCRSFLHALEQAPFKPADIV